MNYIDTETTQQARVITSKLSIFLVNGGAELDHAGDVRHLELDLNKSRGHLTDILGEIQARHVLEMTKTHFRYLDLQLDLYLY